MNSDQGIDINKLTARELNPAIDLDTLAYLIGHIAWAEGPNSVKETDAAFRMMESFLVSGRDDPRALAELGRRVHFHVSEKAKPCLPGAAALAKLVVINGERRLPATKEREQMLLQMMQEEETAILALPQGTTKEWLLSLLHYHAGVFCNATGNFLVAAEAQARSAEAAVRFGDKAGEAIGRFLEVFYRLKHALCNFVEPEDQMRAAYNLLFATLQQRFDPLVEAVCGTPLEKNWGRYNAPFHMLEACVWLNRSHPSWYSWVATALAAAEKLGQALAPGAQFVRAVDQACAVDQAWYGDQGKAEAALQAVADDVSQTGENRATALLVLARRVLAPELDQNSADKILALQNAESFISQMPKTGAQHVRAIAARLLA